ncbi:MAG: MbcA/ParS/Xre antitoxin family protein [Nevskia sp.]|nr:MbcA/ParS/Xre antitoxin family protein [Nevskia sp.]
MSSEIDSRAINTSLADAWVLNVLENTEVIRQVRQPGKLNLNRLRRQIDAAGIPSGNVDRSTLISSEAVHQKLPLELPGEAMTVASVLAFETLGESALFFGHSMRVARHGIGRRLDAVDGEKVIRLLRAVFIATCVLRSAKEARSYLKTPNLALGGMTPLHLLKTAEGSQQLLNELQSHMDCGPV